MKPLKHGMAPLILLLSLTACATSDPVRVEKPTKTHILQETPIPEYHGTTNGEIVEYAADLVDALKSCNEDKKSARGSDGVSNHSDVVR